MLIPLICAALLGASGPSIQPGPNLVLDGIPAVPQGVADQIRRYTEGRSASLRDWHPQRREMLIITRLGDAAQIHLVRAPAGMREQLTFHAGPVNDATFAGKGDWFVLVMDQEGNEQYQLHRYDVKSKQQELITDGKSRNSPPLFDRTGNRFAFTSTQRNGKDFDLYLATGAPGDKPKLLAEVAGMFSAEDFSFDGKQLAVSEYLSANESNIYLFDATTGERKRLNPEGEKAQYGQLRFSGDGKALYSNTNLGAEFLQLQKLELKTMKWQPLTAHIPWDVDGFELSKDGKTLAYTVNEDGFSRLYLMDVKSGKTKKANVPDGVLGGLLWHDNNRDLGFTLTSHAFPADVFSLDAGSGAVTRWTFSEAGPVDPSTFSPAERVTWKGHDGVELHGILYRPDAKKFPGARPLMLAHRGGPEAQSRPVYLGGSNYYLNDLGIGLLYLNIRGSPGYGKKYLALDDGLKRVDAYKDVGSLLDWVATQPAFDKTKILFSGGSYGGHLSLMAAYMYPDRLLANIDNVGISSLLTFLENTAEYRRDLRRVEYGDERIPEVRAFMEKTAPLNNAEKIKNPMLVIQGKNDPRVPISEADQIVKTVRSKGVPVWYLVANDEGHGFQKKSNQQVQVAVTAYFLERLLTGGPEALKVPAEPKVSPK